MRKHFNAILDRFGQNMDYKEGQTNHDVAHIFGIDRVIEELEKFYDKYPEFGC